MIVSCQQCRTKFKIPDQKVTERGVKVRCTRCQHTFRVKREAPEDPFAQFGAGAALPPAEATRPGIFPAGVEASRLGPSEEDASGNVFEVPTRQNPIPVESAPTPSPPARPPVGRVVAAAPMLTSPKVTPQRPTPVAPPLTRPEPARNTPFEPMGFELDESDGPTIALARSPLEQLSAPFGSAEDLPANPFHSGEPEPAEVAEGFASAGAVEGKGDRSELFDMPRTSSPAASPLGEVQEDHLPTDQLEAVRPAAVQLPRRMTAPASAAVPPAEEVAPSAGRPGPTRARALLANLAMAAILMLVVLVGGGAYLNDGHVDLGSVAKLASLFLPKAELSTLDVSNGLYDTQSGRQVFYVRGEIENRSLETAHAQVTVQLYLQDQPLATAQGLAGAVPSPEELFAIAGPVELQALRSRLDGKAVELKPGDRAPFLLAFAEMPADLRAVRVSVTVGPQQAQGASHR